MFGTSSTEAPVAASSAFTCSGRSTLDIMMMSGRPASTPSRSSLPQVSSGLMRTAAAAPDLRPAVEYIARQRARLGPELRRREVLELEDDDVGAAARCGLV